jgi:AcrR family transcriptional regulator
MSKKKKPSAAVPALSDQAVIKACFDMIAEKGLGKTRLSALAAQFNVPMRVFYAAYPSVEAILVKFVDQIDQAMLAQLSPADSDSKRELYFDMMMARCDAMQLHREGVKRWLSELPKQPTLWSGTLKRWEQSLSLMLDMAKDSPLFPVKKIGLAAIYAATLKAWFNDESADMAKTMAALDGALGHGETIIQRFMTKKKVA